jgi:hypothetical protein
MAALLSWLNTTSGRASTTCPISTEGNPALRAKAFCANVFGELFTG